MARAMAGLVTLHPVVNYLDALPVKMFEYMAAGIPVIASHVSRCGGHRRRQPVRRLRRPGDPAAIAAAIDHRAPPRTRPAHGRERPRAVARDYNWLAASPPS
jgi:glycosyltransferase involved in cell wall biosynthesis